MKNKAFISALACLIWAVSASAAAQDIVVDTLELAKAVSKTPATLLQGQVSGVRVSAVDGSPNGAVNTNIRGLNTLHGDGQPLWVVNGVILTNGLSQNLNAFWQKGGYTTKGDELPNYSELSYSSALNGLSFLGAYDIESIEVLKDVAATAIYGTQGANGVILVNTKLPQEGKFAIRWDSNLITEVANRYGSALRPGFSHNHSVGVSGSSEGTAYNISGYLRNGFGVVKNTGETYGGLNVNFETKTNSFIWFGLNSTVSAGVQHNAAGVAYLGRPSTMIVSRYPNRFTGDTLEGWEKDYDDDVEDYRAVSSVYLTVNFMPGLSLKASFGEDFQSNTRRIWYGEGTSFGAANKGAASIMSSTLFNYNARMDLNFQRYIATKHRVSAQLVAEAIGSKNKFGVMNGTTFELMYLRARGLSSSSSRAVPYKFTRDYNIVGTYATLSYDYDGIAGLNASYRADFSLKYGKQPMSYPAVDAYLDLRKLALASNEVVTGLKLKAGYGIAGHEDYVPYEMLGNYLREYPTVDRGTEVYYDGLNRLRSSEWNVGVELALLDRIRFAAKYYDKQTRDSFEIWNFSKILGSYHTWAPKGAVEYCSVGTLSNAGFEFDLDADIIKTSKLKWNVYANAAFNVNRVTSISYDDIAGRNIGKNIYVNVNPLGSSISSLYGYVNDENGDICDLNGDGNISDADKKVLGSTLPKFCGAFGTTLSVAGFTVDLAADGAAGHNIANLNKLIAEGRTKLSSKYVEKGDYLRLSRLSLSYQIPLKTNVVKKLSVNATATNLFTISRYSGWNPDVNCFGNSALSQGVDYGSYPMVRSFVVGVSAIF